MRHTIKTDKYTTSINVPLQKLMSRCKETKLTSTSFPAKETAVPTTTSNCHFYCVENADKPAVTVEMLDELEQLYKHDTSRLESEIQYQQHQNQQLKTTINDLEVKVSRVQSELDSERKISIRVQGELQSQNKKLSIIIQNMIKEKQTVARLHVNQLYNERNGGQIKSDERVNLTVEERNFFWQDKMRAEAEKWERKIDTQAKEFQQVIHELNIKIQNQIKQNTSLKEEIQSYRFQKQRGLIQQERLQQNISSLKQTILSLEQEQKLTMAQVKELTNTLDKKKNQLERKEAQIYELNAHQLKIKCELSEVNLALETLRRLKQELQEEIKIKDKNLVSFEQKYQAIQEEIRQKEEEQLFYKSQLEKRRQNNIYEVKVQKVIHREEYIKQIEQELENEKKLNYNLEKLLEKEQLENKQKKQEIDSLLDEIQNLKKKIVKLQVYIEEKEKSFEWTVQREIVRDIEVSKHENYKTYHVHPVLRQKAAEISSLEKQKPKKLVIEQREMHFQVNKSKYS